MFYFIPLGIATVINGTKAVQWKSSCLMIYKFTVLQKNINIFPATLTNYSFQFSAMNGHAECLRLLMETADDNNIVDVNDARDR